MIGKNFRILLSYHYYKNIDLDKALGEYADLELDVFADSGAYSAMTQGVNITTKEYADWIKRWGHWFSAYSNLDIIMDARRTWENQQTLEDMGLRPLPTFHVAEDWEWLEKYLTDYKYIALGVAGMQLRRTPLMQWLIKCFQMAKGRAVYHGFALTSWNVMKSFPWYSVDSSSWAAGIRYGRVPIFSNRYGRFYSYNLGTKIRGEVYRIVKEFGYDPIDFAIRDRNVREKIIALSVISFREAENYLKRINNSNTRIYIVDGSLSNLNDAYEGIKIYLVENAGLEILSWVKGRIE